MQRRIPASYRDRVFSAFTMVWQTGRIASLALAGLLVDVLSIPALYVGAGVLLVAAGLLGLSALSLAASPTPADPDGPVD